MGFFAIKNVEFLNAGEGRDKSNRCAHVSCKWVFKTQSRNAQRAFERGRVESEEAVNAA